jgi:peptidoglycan/LPS O-acetylase OafA/YrhL
MNFESYWGIIQIIDIIGPLGVELFFVISGFLITYLLLSEEQNFKTICVKKFYIRRILRIWPLYFLILILAFVVLPHINFFTLPHFEKDTIYQNYPLQLILLAIIFPNIAFNNGFVPYASQTWSIGTEEQFYLIWPVILKYIRKHRLLLMLSVIVFYNLSGILLTLSFTDFIPGKDTLTAYWSQFQIDSIATGGVFALLYFQKSKVAEWFLNTKLFYIALISIVLIVLSGIHIPFFQNEIFALFFGIIILNFAANKNIKISLESKLLSHLGTISYGLYMYHSIAIVITIRLAAMFNFVNNWLIYPLSLFISIALAELSYRYFERYFLKLKHRYSLLQSGNI